MTLFKDRRTAGRKLAAELTAYANTPKVALLALPRGGVPVAYEIAKALHFPIDIVIVRKLEVPGNKELAMGAVASGGIRIIDHDVVRLFNISQFAIDAVVAEEQLEIRRLEQLYRDGWPAINIHDYTVIVVDDGIATGATMNAAVSSLKQRSPSRIIVAAPTASPDSYMMLSELVDEIVCLSTPEPYIAVARWYEDYTPVKDEDISVLLIQATKDLCAFAVRRHLH